MKISIEQTQKFTPKQCEIFDACAREDIDYVVVSCGRQVGKSSAGLWQSIKWALNKPCSIGFFQPTHSQCKNIFDRFKKALAPMIKSKKCSFVGSPAFEITFWNGSVIKLKTGNNDNFRGQTFDYMVIDEACFIKNDIFNVMLPCVAVSLSKPIRFRGKVLMLSTPKTKNWFYGYVKSERHNVKVIRFTSLQGGTYSKQLLDEIRAMTPDHIFKNEYEGEFLDSGCGLFKYIPCIKNISDKKGCVAALDLGQTDSSVLTIMNANGNVIYVGKWNQQDYDAISAAAIAKCQEYGKPRLYVESNGVGKSVYEYIKKRYNGITTEWHTSHKSKNDIVVQLILDFNTQNITIPDNEDLKMELDAFTVEWKNGSPFYEGSNGFHDDHVISLCICNFNRPKIVGAKAVTIQNNRSNAI